MPPKRTLEKSSVELDTKKQKQQAPFAGRTVITPQECLRRKIENAAEQIWAEVFYNHTKKLCETMLDQISNLLAYTHHIPILWHSGNIKEREYGTYMTSSVARDYFQTNNYLRELVKQGWFIQICVHDACDDLSQTSLYLGDKILTPEIDDNRYTIMYQSWVN